MQASLVKTFIGVFALDEKRKVLSFKPFSKDPAIVSGKLSENEPDEYRQIKDELGDFEFVAGDKEAESYVKENLLKYARV
ncbi:MAG: hypothetical protein HYS80_00590 [Candidatus Aenigmarchaeota archaeon]|nr:hypothetical protein [Candidatus Aenigmarchaeota archaeon]